MWQNKWRCYNIVEKSLQCGVASWNYTIGRATWFIEYWTKNHQISKNFTKNHLLSCPYLMKKCHSVKLHQIKGQISQYNALFSRLFTTKPALMLIFCLKSSILFDTLLRCNFLKNFSLKNICCHAQIWS